MPSKLPATTDQTPTQYHDPVSMAAAAFLARYKTNSRRTYTVALRCYLNWCRLNGLDPLVAQRPHIELFSRMMEEQKYERTTHAKYVSVVCLFYKFCLIDGYISTDPALQVRKIPWPTDSEHGHRVLAVLGKGDKKVLVPLPPAVARMIDRAVGDRMSGPICLNQIGTAMDGQAQARALKRIARLGGVKTTRMHPHMLRHTFVTTMLDAGVDIRDVQIAARHADPRTTTRYDRARENLDRHGNYILAAYMAGAT